ncbi:hypothetical protein FRB94_013503 [Tulasnella sp. JGI-2019a]|nr:hypothetical protein FRB94_013503 [Tulasnella sp. JGI-2019a]KAG8994932.1 hypothetical protein FRB93_001374 [Tulasnella sp. JGI-2019a]
MGVAAAFHANHESNVTKANAKAAVAGLNLGTTLEIDTNDVYTAGEVAGIAQLGLALVAAISILLLLIDTKKRHAVPNAPHVRKAPFSSRTLILQLLALIGANIFAIATAAVTTDFVSKRSAKVTSTFANGTVVPPTLIAALSAQLGISPVYKDQNYLVFLAIAPWIGVLFGLIATLITFHAWRRYKTSRSEAETEAEAAVETGSIYDMTEKD